jgi:UDP-N-acetylglucosamine--N-acetylmuramyl-(pentapeptide) pyrophosphoryl-undecaprenol N-acetylglucosamine transferase
MIRRIVVAGGGTGGHLFPGMAVVEELARRSPGLEVTWVGTARGIETRVVPRAGFALELLDVTPLKGRSPFQLLASLGRLPRAGVQALGLLRRLRPDVVLGVGGYASGPSLAAAAGLRIPTAVLEQNAHVGLTNRVLSRLVGRAYLSFAETAAAFGEQRARVTGNPVRRAFVDAARLAASDPDGLEARARHVLVLGGSQGARALNEAVPGAIARARAAMRGVRVVHQTGPASVDDVRARYAALGVDAEVTPFVEDVARALSQAAVVVARAGATTIAELCAIGRPSILVPLPHAADDHQTKNALALVRAGAALCVPEAELDPARLGDELARLLADATARRSMAEAARALGHPDAAAAIVDDLLAFAGERGGSGDHEGGGPHAGADAGVGHLEGSRWTATGPPAAGAAPGGPDGPRDPGGDVTVAPRRFASSTIAPALDDHAPFRRRPRVRRGPLPPIRPALGATGTWE